MVENRLPVRKEKQVGQAEFPGVKIFEPYNVENGDASPLQKPEGGVTPDEPHLKGRDAAVSQAEKKFSSSEIQTIILQCENAGFIEPEVDKVLVASGCSVDEIGEARKNLGVKHFSDSELKQLLFSFRKEEIPWDDIWAQLSDVGEKVSKNPQGLVERAKKLLFLRGENVALPDGKWVNFKTITFADGRTIKIHTEDPNTALEIRDIFRGQNFPDTEEYMNQTSEIQRSSSDEGWLPLRFIQPFAMGCGQIYAHIVGNEEKRAAENSKIPFQECQAPDGAKKACARNLLEMIKVFEEIDGWISGAIRSGSPKDMEEAMKKSAGAVLEVCKLDNIATTEACVEGNNLESGDRVFDPSLTGPCTALLSLLKREIGDVTAESLQRCCEEYGREWVDEAVQTCYKFPFGGNERKNLQKAYANFYANNGLGDCPNLDGMIFNPELRALRSKRQEIIENWQALPDITPDKAEILADSELEGEWQAYLKEHLEKMPDGTYKLDVGHVVIMVNEAQLSLVTLRSLNCL